jgi:hypothetical protein
MSIFGFLVNFLYPYLAYRLWHRMMRGHELRLDLYGLGCFWAATFAPTLSRVTGSNKNKEKTPISVQSSRAPHL